MYCGARNPAGTRPKHAEFDVIELSESVEAVKARRGGVRRHRAGVVGRGAGHSPLPGGFTIAREKGDSPAHHWFGDSRGDEASDVVSTYSVYSGLRTGEDVVLRGYELGHNAQSVDPHEPECDRPH